MFWIYSYMCMFCRISSECNFRQNSLGHMNLRWKMSFPYANYCHLPPSPIAMLVDCGTYTCELIHWHLSASNTAMAARLDLKSKVPQKSKCRKIFVLHNSTLDQWRKYLIAHEINFQCCYGELSMIIYSPRDKGAFSISETSCWTTSATKNNVKKGLFRY